MYALEDVDAAEARIQAEVPDAIVSRGDYGWRLYAKRRGRPGYFVVFDHTDGGAVIWGDVDRIIEDLNK